LTETTFPSGPTTDFSEYKILNMEAIPHT